MKRWFVFCALTAALTAAASAAADPPATGSLGEVRAQNDRAKNRVRPEGVPPSIGFSGGAVRTGGAVPPNDFSAVTGWGVLYPEAGSDMTADVNATVTISHMQTWVHLRRGGWERVQDQAEVGLGGAHYPADFNGNPSPWTMRAITPGSARVDAPAPGLNDHFWEAARGVYSPLSVDGVYVTLDASVDNPKAKIVAQIGADWWRDRNAQSVPGFKNNPSPGMNNFTELKTTPTTLFYVSDIALLERDLPPGLKR